jgi:hypothetical protein
LLGIPDQARNSVRLPLPEWITPVKADELRDELREFAHLGGFAMRPDSSPWYGAALRTPEEARRACHLAARLGSHSVPRLVDRHGRLSDQVGLVPPANFAETQARSRLYAAIGQTLGVFDPGVYAAGPRALADATAGRGEMSMIERHRLRKRARDLYIGTEKVAREQLTELLTRAAKQLDDWRGQRPGGAVPGQDDAGRPPRLPADLAALAELSRSARTSSPRCERACGCRPTSLRHSSPR